MGFCRGGGEFALRAGPAGHRPARRGVYSERCLGRALPHPRETDFDKEVPSEDTANFTNAKEVLDALIWPNEWPENLDSETRGINKNRRTNNKKI